MRHSHDAFVLGLESLGMRDHEIFQYRAAFAHKEILHTFVFVLSAKNAEELIHELVAMETRGDTRCPWGGGEACVSVSCVASHIHHEYLPYSKRSFIFILKLDIECRSAFFDITLESRDRKQNIQSTEICLLFVQL